MNVCTIFIVSSLSKVMASEEPMLHSNWLHRHTVHGKTNHLKIRKIAWFRTESFFRVCLPVPIKSTDFRVYFGETFDFSFLCIRSFTYAFVCVWFNSCCFRRLCLCVLPWRVICIAINGLPYTAIWFLSKLSK